MPVKQPPNGSVDTGRLLETLQAVARGDFSVRMPTDQAGITGKIYDTVNEVIELNDFSVKEFQRVHKEVGQEGKITQRASPGSTRGAWRTYVDSFNGVVDDLVQPMTEVGRVIDAVAKGDLSKKITMDVRGEMLGLKNTINTMVDQLRSFSSEVTRVAREIGSEGKLGTQATVEGVAGTWKDLTDTVNAMVDNLTVQMRNISEVAEAVANGDVSEKITVDVRGEILGLKNTINSMVDQLGSFSSQVTRVAREVGTEGKLGVQATVKGVAGAWKDLTDGVNTMSDNLTRQMRNISAVAKAVATGDLSTKITVEVRGEILELKNTINSMVDQLSSFSSEVTRVAREVGVEGTLGAQANVPEAAGIWRELTDNVNELAANLTTQVRAIGEVATAVTKGDLTRSIAVEARGELAELRDGINAMIGNLRGYPKSALAPNRLNYVVCGPLFSQTKEPAHGRASTQSLPGAFRVSSPCGKGSFCPVAGGAGELRAAVGRRPVRVGGRDLRQGRNWRHHDGDRP